MGRCTVTLFLALAALSLASALHTFVPAGKELVYDYKALVKAGTVIPASYASEFFLHGKLHLQSGDAFALVQLSDLKYKLYNGDRHYGHEHELEEIVVPEQAADLLKPFKIYYEKNGQVKSVATEKDEKMYARNMHKAIANVLQLDLEQIHLDSKHAHAFTTEEYSIFGKTVAAYNVLPKGDDKIVIQKMHEMKTTKPLYMAMISSTEPDFCEAHYEEPMSHDSHQFYYIKKHDGHFVAKHIESTGGIYIYPFQAKSEAQYVFANVTLNLVDVVPVTKALQVAAEHVEEDLTYDIVDPSIETVMPDIMNGRRVVDMHKQIPVVETMLGEMVVWLHENHLHMRHPDIKHGQLVNRIVRLLTVFDKATLEQLYTTLSGKTTDEGKKHLEIMHQLLPLVGTHASVLLVKKIVHEKKVDDHLALHMLSSVPAHVRVPTEKMLQEIEDMLTWGDDINVHVRNAAILCFSSLIHKTFEIQKRIAQAHPHHHHHHGKTHNHEHVNLHISGFHHYSHVPEDVKKFIDEHKIYNKYVTDFAAKMKSAQDYNTKMLYMQALYNTKLHSVVEHLVPIVKGEEVTEHHMRLMALWAISPMVLGDSEKVFELYWPIFSDWSQHIELRMLAYYAIMQSHPPISRLLNIYWEMQAEQNTELYHFHYNYLLNMARTTDPCHQITRLNAAQILKLTRKPNQQAISTFYKMDYIDKKYKFGGDFTAFLMASQTSRMFYFETNSQMFNVYSNYYGLFIRIGGLKETIAKTLHLNLDSTTELFNFNEVSNLIKTLEDLKEINVQIAIAHHNQIVQSYFFDSSNIKNMDSIFSFFANDKYSKVKNSIEIHYEMFTQILMPTEMGIPALMEIVVPSIHHKHININKDVANNLINIHFDNQHHIARHSRYGLSFYNPIADIWQGVNRYHSYDLVFPIYADVTINTQQHSVKISMKRHQDEHKDAFGLRSHATTMVFVKDDFHYGVLEKSCGKCQLFTVVTKGDQYRHNHTLRHSEGYNTGYNYQTAVYDSELDASFGKFHEVMSMVASKHTKNYWTPVGYLTLFLRNWHMLVLLQPISGTHGILFKAVPSTENPITQIDLTFRLNTELVQEKHQYLPGMKFNTRFTYVLKNKEKAVKTWDLNAIIDVNAGHTLRNSKIDVTRIIPGQKDFKVCLESTKKWTMEGVNGHMNILMGQTTDGKCNKDGATIDVTMVGEQLPEQKTPYHSYEICQPYSHHLGADYHSLYCLAAHTAIRKYTFDVKTTNIATEYKKIFYSGFEHFKQAYKAYYTHDDDDDEDVHVEENHAKIVLEYPTVGDEMNVEVITPHFDHEFHGIPTRSLSYWGFSADNTHFSELYMMMHHMGMMHTCTVVPEHVEHGLNHAKHIEAFQVPNEWTMYLGDVAKDAQHGVFLKKVEGNLLALKTMHGSHSVEIYPQGKHAEHFKVLVDGKELSDAVDYHTEDWFSIMVRPHLHSVIMTTTHFQLHMEYTGDKVIIEIPRVGGVQFHGHCVKSA